MVPTLKELTVDEKEQHQKHMILLKTEIDKNNKCIFICIYLIKIK